jgi:Tol biopolymer transport system component
MRRLAAFRIGVAHLPVVGLLAAAAAVLLFAASGPAAGSRASSGAFRILYVSDWSGTGEVYAVDPSGGHPTAQLTFGRAPTCAQVGCGYSYLGSSPDGRFILYTDSSACGFSSTRSALFVANADGAHARVLARTRRPSDCPYGIYGVWAPDSKHAAYAVDGQIHTVDLDGSRNRVVGRGDAVSWSPRGKALAILSFDSSSPYGRLSVRMNGRARVVAAAVSAFEWSPNGRWLAYGTRPSSGEDKVDIVRADGSGRRSLLTAPYISIAALQWSADSRFLGASGDVVNIASGAIRSLGPDAVVAWKPRGHLLASSGPSGTSVVDAATGATRPLTSDQAAIGRWSPYGRQLAYLTGTFLSYFSTKSALRVVNLAGQTHTLVTSAGPYGGNVSGPTWTRVPNGVRYRPAQPRVLARTNEDGLTASWTITRLAADGDRIAYIACGHVFVWTPSTKTIVQAEPSSSLSPRCTLGGTYLPFWLYTLALSGDRIAFGEVNGNMSQGWGLYDGRVDDPASFVSLASVSSVNGCAVGSGGLGDLAGSTTTLVFGTWTDDLSCPARTLDQNIHRVDGIDCPCPVIASSPGPLVPFEVDSGRIVAGGDNATVIYDASGKELLAVPVSPLAAQLTGSNLVILEQGHLLVYDATTGAQLHDWPLPNVPSGSECASPHGATWECSRNAQLVLEDAARDLAVYVVNDEVHVVQLQNGTDTTIGKGTLARFMNAGLVYADGAKLRLVPFGQLPVR